MPILHPVAQRTVLLCDYDLGGFVEPEMVKKRPAVVMTPRLPHRNGLCAVIPLSGTEPAHPVPYVVRVELAQPLPEPFSQTVFWAKCDMVATVAFKRLELFRTPRLPGGQRQYLQPKMPEDIFKAVQAGMLHGLALGHLTLT